MIYYFRVIFMVKKLPNLNTPIVKNKRNINAEENCDKRFKRPRLLKLLSA